MATKERAKESRLVQRARKKLEKSLEVEHQKFTTEALHDIAVKIRTSIQRHHPEASFLKKRKFTVFDENAHPAKTKSKQITKLQHMLAINLNPIKTD